MATRECDAVLVVSAEEKDVLASQVPEQTIAVISNIHEVSRDIPPYEARRGLVFIGGFEHPPNVDAMLWFCQEIMPRILEQLPDSILHIVGSKTPESILALASKSVIPHGYVEKVESLFQSCLLSVAPLRFGAGVKGKINQSMSHGVPVVSTSIGVEGMHVVHEKSALVADDPLDFAAQVVRLHRDACALERTIAKRSHEHRGTFLARRRSPRPRAIARRFNREERDAKNRVSCD